MIALDFGCSTQKRDGAYGVDIDFTNKPDILFDLNKFPYPLRDSSVDRITAHHILEHLGDLYGIFREAYRVLKDGGDFFIEVPHFSCRVAYSEPEHNRYFSYFMFDKLIASIRCQVLKRQITFHKSFRRVGLQWIANRYPNAFERFWIYLFPAENVKLHLKIVKS